MAKFCEFCQDVELEETNSYNLCGDCANELLERMLCDRHKAIENIKSLDKVVDDLFINFRMQGNFVSEEAQE